MRLFLECVLMCECLSLFYDIFFCILTLLYTNVLVISNPLYGNGQNWKHFYSKVSLKRPPLGQYGRNS